MNIIYDNCTIVLDNSGRLRIYESGGREIICTPPMSISGLGNLGKRCADVIHARSCEGGKK